ncbi:MAG: S8 family serine peptidase [Chitinophagales bacterium]|nr:S8 family serine peptidase [Chitinophagales bacterium]
MRILSILVFLLFSNSVFTQDYFENRLFIKVKDEQRSVYSLVNDVRFEKILPRALVKSLLPVSKHPLLSSTYELILNESYALDSLVAKIQQLEQIEYAEKVPLYKLFFTPNDPLYSTQWNLAKIQADLAWNLGQGCTQVKIAVTDDGFLMNHEDLVNQWHINTGEINGNGIDDDGNGYIDDWRGWDAANNDNDPSATAPTNSFFTHGTHVAGIVAAQTHNNKGIAAIGYNCKMIPVKIGLSPSSSLTGAFQGLDYAINASGCDVINMSWGGGAWSATFQTLFNIAKSKGIICVAAAGNSNTSTPMYPASYNHVISVAASGSTDARASFSNFGSTIDVTAPGVGIPSCLAGSITSYGNLSGTSMASPLVAGLCGLMKCYNPMPADSIEACLKRTCDNINAQNPTFIGQLGAGRVNAFQALQCLTKKPKSDFIALDTFQCPTKAVRYQAKSFGIPTLTYSWSFPGGSPATSTSANPIVTYATAGYKSATLITCNSLGCDTMTKTNYVNIDTPKAWLNNRVYTTINAMNVVIAVHFKGRSPFSVTLTDGSNTWTQTNIQSNPYLFSIQPKKDTSILSISSFSDSSCAGNKYGQDTIYRKLLTKDTTICVTLKTSQSGALDGFGLSPTSSTNITWTFANNENVVANWTAGGSPHFWRCILKFNLSNIPANAVINSASLSLYSKPNASHGWSGQPTAGTDNSTSISRITNSWTTTSIATNAWPSTTVQNQVTLAQSPTTNHSYTNVNVKNLIQDLINNGDNGIFLRHVNTPFYNSLIFYSAEETDTSKHPKLVLCYTIPAGSSGGGGLTDCDTSQLNTGKVLHLDFNGNTQDKSGNGNHATNYGATPVAGKDGVANTAYRFNGTSNYMQIANSSSLNNFSGNKITLTAILKPRGFYNGTCKGNSIIMKGNSDYVNGNYLLRYSPNNGCNASADTNENNFYGAFSSAGGCSLSSIHNPPYVKRDTWYCLVSVYTGDSIITYINGARRYSCHYSGGLGSHNLDVFIGKLDNATYPYWLNADVDDIRIYNRVLAPAEVKGYCGTCNVQPPQINCNSWLKTVNIGDKVTVGDLDVSGDKLTVEAWVNRENRHTGVDNFSGDIVSKHTGPTNSNYNLRIQQAEITTSNNGYVVTPSFCSYDTNKTYHVAMVYDGANLKFYRNGYLMTSVAASGNLITNNLNTTIADYAGVTTGQPENMNGYINEVRIWNIARTQTQLRMYMSDTLPNPTSQTGLLGYYRFDNLLNKQGNTAYNGTLGGNAQINQINPNCNLVIDSCGIIIPPQTDCDTSQLNTGKVLHLDFNGNTQDKSGNNNHATNYGATPVAGKDGVANTAYKFDGVNDYMKVLNSSTLHLNSAFTVTCKMKIDGWNTAPCHGNMIFFKGHTTPSAGNQHIDWVYAPNAFNGGCIPTLDTLHQNLHPASVTAPSPKPYIPYLNSGKWYCFAVVQKNDTLFNYIDGFIVSKTSNTGTGANMYDILIGKSDYATYPYWLNATIDDIRVYNRSLAPAEVKGYCGTCNAAPPSPSDCDTSQLNTGKVLHLDFNGNTQDKSGNNNHATNYGATAVADRFGNPNSAYRFNGSTSKMIISNFPTSSSNNLSLSIWFKSNSTSQSSYAGLLDHSHSNGGIYQNWVLQHYQTNKKADLGWRISASAWSNTDNTGPTYDNTKWNHLVAIKNSDTLTYYLNCIKIYSNKFNGTQNILKQFADLNIGFVASWNRYFNGDIDDIRIYHRVLNDQEIKALGDCCSTTTPPPPCDTAQKLTYTQCLNDSLQVTLRAGSQYQWSPKMGLSSDTVRNPKIYVTANQRYLVSYIGAKGCQVIDTIDISVRPSAIYPKMEDQLICIGDSVQMTIPIYATNVQWSPNTNISSITANNPFFYPTVNTTYYLQFRDTFGCLHKDTFVVNTKVCCPARARFSIPKEILCFGEDLTITNRSKGPITGYNWNFGNAIPSSFAGANPPVLKFPAGGTYPLRLIVTNGICFDTMTKIVTVVQVFPNAGKDTTNCLGAFVTDLGESPISDWTYKWTPTIYLDDPNIANPKCSIVNDSVNYVVEVTDRNSGCKAYDTAVVYTNRSIDSTAQNLRICNGDSVLFNGIQRKTTGNYYFTIKKADGFCDSFINILRLNVLQKQVIPLDTLRKCEQYIDAKGKKHTQSFIEYDTIRSKSILNCDSMVYIRHIYIYKKAYRDRPPVSGCAPFRYNGKTYNDSKMRIDSLVIRNIYLPGCDTIEYINVIVFPKPKAVITPSIPNPVLYKQTVTLSASGGQRYFWLQTGSTNQDIDYKINNTQPKLFTVRVTDENECWDTVSYLVKGILPDTCYYGFPNVFSPNQDNLNDEYIPNMDECTDVIVFAIYDRWGEKVFETNQLKGWNGYFKGRPAPMGVYLYYAEFNTPWGIRKHKGTFTLMR